MQINFQTISFLIFCFFFLSSCQIKNQWPKINREQKPWTYWWWMGSAVDKENIHWNLKKYKDAGIGGVHIIPIYGVKGEEAKFLDFMSPEWQEMVAFTAEEAAKLDMGVDMTLGTGWCYGGPEVNEKTGLMRSSIDEFKIEKSIQQFDCSSNCNYPFNKIETVLAILPDGSRIDMTEKLDANEKLIENLTSGTHLYVMRIQGPTYKVKRAAPGGDGYMLDPFSTNAFDWYSRKFDDAFQNKLKGKIRAIYHDSYEYYNADWTSNFYEEFKKQKGYDLKIFLPELNGEHTNDTVIRILADYREVAADLHIAYISRIKEWAEKNHINFRNQAHGSPTNWLDTYSAAGIPETESFGSSKFNIPGLDRDSNFIRHDEPDKLLMKFASSAAHVSAGKLVSSETHTWLREHFQIALSHCKPELDKLFLAGINHVFYHGIAYSPKDAAWPGWLFYAESNFAPSNSIYRHFPAMNNYVARCQSVLQAGKSDNDILLYFPIQDIWHSPLNKGKKLFQLTVHDDIIRSTPFYQLALALDSAGFSFDYISDKQLLASNAEKNWIITAGGNYKALLIPSCKYLPVTTLAKIEELIKSGIHVIFMDQIPEEPAGFSNLEESKKSVVRIKSGMKELSPDNFDVISSSEPNKLAERLLNWNILKEDFPAYKLSFIRRESEDGYYYFISNLYSGHSVNAFVPLAVKCNNVILLNPVTQTSGKAEILNQPRNTKVHIQLEPGESLIMKATNQRLGKIENWQYIVKEENPLLIEGTWEIKFIEGGPELPSPIITQALKTWTELGDTAQTQKFGGTARYSIQFEMMGIKADDYILSFDEVHESVAVKINGQQLPVLFAYPFKQRIGKYLKKGLNDLEIEVANLSANRVRYLDQQHIDWKHFYNINYPNIKYEPFDASDWEIKESGIIGKVKLIPVSFVHEQSEYSDPKTIY